MFLKSILSFLFIFAISGTAFAEIKTYRWVNNTFFTDNLEVILNELNSKNGLHLSTTDFALVEDRPLATSHFKTYAQLAEGVPVEGALLRTWADVNTRILIQMEADLDDGQLSPARKITLKAKSLSARGLKSYLAKLNNMTYVQQVVLNHTEDNRIVNVKSKDQWAGADLIRVIEVRGRKGTHKIYVSHFSKKVVKSTYTPFATVDLQALVYPIYEQTEKQKLMQDRMPVMLKNLLSERKNTSQDPYAPLRTRRYFEDMLNPVLGETEEGRAQGYWSANWLLSQAMQLFNALPNVANSFQNGGMFLEGKYATINLHPEAASKSKNLDFTPSYSSRLAVMWKSSPTQTGQERWEVVPTGARYGRPLTTPTSALERVARRLPDHDMGTYINDGFDEVQVYYAIDRLMESMHSMGFSDPELSTRPFHAFLYDPDISMRDNAYYTNDTINFTTYSPESQNFARDNSTIWHELGHGLMDRLMGDLIELADTGGLAEGMADFIAQLVVQDVTNSQPFPGSADFRIMNQTGFSLTNESHDDGEAYGGAMNDMLTQAIAKWGRSGLVKMTDLTLEAMRLARNHPGLTANDWFEHMLYADQLGRAQVRAPNEMRSLIISSIEQRNFRLDRGPVADFEVLFDKQNILADSGPGSRRLPIAHELGQKDSATHELSLRLKDSENYQFKYPLTVEVQLNGGPLQGAVKWQNEAAAPFKYTIVKAGDTVDLNLGSVAGCDFINREDSSCSDFAYIKVFNNGDSRPVAKKRFYLRTVSK
jgi:hypothetical protein